MKKIILQGFIIILMIGIIWLFKMLPQWMIEREMEKQLSMIMRPSVRMEKKEILQHEPIKIESGIKKPSQEKIISSKDIHNALKMIKDPEIDINIVDLGLIQDIKVSERGIIVGMILTSRFCPYQGYLVKSVREAVKKISGENSIEIILDYSKTWTASELTQDGKKQWEQFFGPKKEKK